MISNTPPHTSGKSLHFRFHLIRTTCAALISVSSLVNAGALDDYIKNPEVIANPPWRGQGSPEERIPRYIKGIAEAKTDSEKAIQVSNLIFITRQMADVPEARPAAAEVLAKHIMPNLHFTKQLESTNAASWRHSLIACKHIYQKLGDHEAVRECLATLYRESTKPGDKEMSVYLLAFQQAEQSDYKTAVKTINLLPNESKWASQRPNLIKYWNKMQKQAEVKAKQNSKK